VEVLERNVLHEEVYGGFPVVFTQPLLSGREGVGVSFLAEWDIG
jgi:hypothetical protein